MRRILLLAAALAIPASGFSLALTGGAASAASGPKGKTVCTSLAGTTSGTITISGCTDVNGANTGGASHPLPGLSFASGGAVPWVSGKTTTFSAPTVTPTSSKHCPGYAKTNTKNPTAFKISGGVTSDTAGFKVPGTYKGEVCLSADGVTVSSPKPLKIN
jgi:hypothetical protein